tara:strand:+ start:1797 stop:2369 length:573 start_codon:yes stop_codon:yes gene_type:complete
MNNISSKFNIINNTIFKINNDLINMNNIMYKNIPNNNEKLDGLQIYNDILYELINIKRVIIQINDMSDDKSSTTSEHSNFSDNMLKNFNIISINNEKSSHNKIINIKKYMNNDIKLCYSCLNNDREFLFLNCGHLTFCNDCIKKVIKDDNYKYKKNDIDIIDKSVNYYLDNNIVCPVCRQTPYNIEKIHI